MSKFVKANGPFLKYSNFERSRPVLGFYGTYIDELQELGDDSPGLPVDGSIPQDWEFTETGFLIPPKIMAINAGYTGTSGTSAPNVPFYNSSFLAYKELKEEIVLQKNNWFSGFVRYSEQPDVFAPGLYSLTFGSHQPVDGLYSNFVIPAIPVEDGFFGAEILYLSIIDGYLDPAALNLAIIESNIQLTISKFKEFYDRFYKIKCVVYLADDTSTPVTGGLEYMDGLFIDMAAELFDYGFEYRGMFDASGCFARSASVSYSETGVAKIKELVTLEAANFFD